MDGSPVFRIGNDELLTLSEALQGKQIRIATPTNLCATVASVEKYIFSGFATRTWVFQVPLPAKVSLTTSNPFRQDLTLYGN